MSSDDITAFINAFAHDPLLLGIALALATLVSEDAALITGAVLASNGMTSEAHVIFWLTVGILGGDIGLYLLGYTAQQNSWIRRRIPIRKAASFRRWLKDREISVLFLSRLMPGTRLPTYVSYGFLRMSLMRFTLVMGVACITWVTAMVYFVREIQSWLSMVDGRLGAIGAAVIAFLVLYLIPRLIKKRRLIPEVPEEPEDPETDDQGGVTP